MDKIIALTESSLQQSSVEIDEATFLCYMKSTPILDYFKISQAKYLSHAKEEKLRLISDCYIRMQQGKISPCIFLFLAVGKGGGFIFDQKFFY